MLSGKTKRDPEVQALVDKQAIRDCLARYSRGIDRMDPDFLKTVYHPDGSDNHGIFDGNAWEFAEFIAPFDKELGVEQQTHWLDNILIELVSETEARVETYHTAFAHCKTDDGMVYALVGGRYLDRFEKRDGHWKIADRVYCMDWNMNGPSTVNWSDGLYSQLQRGKWGMDDISYDFFPPELLRAAGLTKKP